MKKQDANIGLIQRHVKRGLRFLSGKQCYKVLNISGNNIHLFYKGIKMNISSKLFYEILSKENPQIINSWKSYEEIIGN